MVFETVFQLVLQNTGNVGLMNLSLVDDVVAQLGAAFVSVASLPAITASTATTNPNLNAAWPAPANIFDGISGQLDPGQTLTITFALRLDPHAPGAAPRLTNQAIGSATTALGGSVSDESDSGSNPATSNPGDPGDTGGSDDPTPIRFPIANPLPLTGPGGLIFIITVLMVLAAFTLPRRWRP